MSINKYGISNFKCFENQTDVVIRPITINIGPNNSGKSSIIKSLKLLKSSIEEIKPSYDGNTVAILENINSYNLVDFGEPNDFLFNQEKEFSFSISVPKLRLANNFQEHEVKVYLFYKFTSFDIDTKEPTNLLLDSILGKPIDYSKLLIGGYIDGPKGRGVLTKYEIKVDDFETIQIVRDLRMRDFGAYEGSDGAEPGYDGEISFKNQEILFSIIKGDLSKLNIYNPIKLEFANYSFADKKKLCAYLKEFLSKYSIGCSELVNSLIQPCLEYVIDFQENLKNLEFIHLDRKSEKRFIDKNNSTLFKICIDNYFNNDFKDAGKIHSSLRELLPLFGLPSEFKIDYQSDFGFQFKLKVAKDIYRNIADFGSGINMLLPLLLAMETKNSSNLIHQKSRNENVEETKSNRLLIVEEPESNLHPALQSKLADMFSILHQNGNLDFIIESHSEFLIRRFQILIAKGEFKPQDIVINYFWKDDLTKERKCKQIYFKENGELSDMFERGFFDESLTTQREILLQNSLN
jgi:hypothetical protein